MKVHIHSDQFDGWLHAECGAGDWEPPSERCVEADVFECLPREQRCRKCSAYWFPNGEPSDVWLAARREQRELEKKDE